MPDPIQTYPFDPTGSAVTNKVLNEKQALVPPTWKDFHFIIPKSAPFFGNTLVLTNVDTGQTLVEGVDWIPSHKFLDASRATARSVYGSITFLNKELSAVVNLDYQTLGGDWLIDPTTIVEILSNKLGNPRITTWDETVNIPYQFPVIDHLWNLVDMVGMTDVVAAMATLQQTIIDRPSATGLLSNHVANENNPHNVSKEQLSLGYVKNHAPASLLEAEGGMRTDRTMSPETTKAAIVRFAMTNPEDHYTRTEVDNMFAALRLELGL